MRNLITRAVNVVGLGAAGVAGGLLTRYEPVSFWLLREHVFPFWGGLWLGLTFAAFFCAAGRDRSLWRPVVLVVASAAALYGAMAATT